MVHDHTSPIWTRLKHDGPTKFSNTPTIDYNDCPEVLLWFYVKDSASCTCCVWVLVHEVNPAEARLSKMCRSTKVNCAWARFTCGHTGQTGRTLGLKCAQQDWSVWPCPKVQFVLDVSTRSVRLHVDEWHHLSSLGHGPLLTVLFTRKFLCCASLKLCK